MAAPIKDLAISPAATKKPAPRASGPRPDEVFSRDGPLGAKADVRAITSDGQELWLHRVVLEIWSRFFRDLIAAHEDEMDPIAASPSPSPVVTITLTDSAADLMLLLSCLYPASCHHHHADRKQSGSTLDAASFLPLLGLADKYHCSHVIDRCAAFAADNILPRLAVQPCACPVAAAEYLQLQLRDQQPPVSGLLFPGPRPGPLAAAAGVLEWVVRCLELAVRLDLDELAEQTAALLGQRFFDWGLQDPAHSELMTRVVRVLRPDQLVSIALRAIPTPAASTATGMGTANGVASWKASGGTSAAAATARGDAAGNGAAADAHGGGGGGDGGGGGGGGPRIVPIMVAAAGPVAVAMQNLAPPLNQPQAAAPQAAAAAAPQPQPLVGWGPQPLNHHQQQHGHEAWFAPAGHGGPGPFAHGAFGGHGGGVGGGPMNFGLAGGHGGAANPPEPLLGLGGGGGW